MNPARSFGCTVATPGFPGYYWIYWLGLALGVALVAGYYRFVKMCHYEEVNPGRDASNSEEFITARSSEEQEMEEARRV